MLDWSDEAPSAPPAPRPPTSRQAPAPRPPSSRQAPPSSNSGAAPPECTCGDKAAERTVVKDNENKGRKFWTCENKVCNFFQWFDGPSNSAGPSTFATNSRAPSSTSVPSKRPLSSAAPGTRGGQRRCQCNLASTLRETTTGANKGRKYWSCSKQSREERCGYFEWEDEAVGAPGQPQRSYSNTSNDGGHGGGCFQCGEEGHWANGEFLDA